MAPTWTVFNLGFLPAFSRRYLLDSQVLILSLIANMEVGFQVESKSTTSRFKTLPRQNYVLRLLSMELCVLHRNVLRLSARSARSMR